MSGNPLPDRDHGACNFCEDKPAAIRYLNSLGLPIDPKLADFLINEMSGQRQNSPDGKATPQQIIEQAIRKFYSSSIK